MERLLRAREVLVKRNLPKLAAEGTEEEHPHRGQAAAYEAVTGVDPGGQGRI